MNVTVRIYFRGPDGKVEDGRQDYGLEDFAGFLPSIGDTILNPGVLQGLDRSEPQSRDIWKVVDRIFNPRDLVNYVVLVVEERRGTEADTWL
ncbi:hypothetical protein [Rhizobium sp. LC145]|uniref:hypothetical protein n=1 Tax=Rhizobium sp. LC145 TaxID=1120688 RepID=UPI000629F49B|nr:hypothetical protein [Rhizobium sp. LC145]KKX29339.1 hypothetical protein YH62_16295 [Rhizobium sp. LC145]MDX3927860.1 hypothetical protein [Shinella sp.]TKT68949.1 hypothetical protein FDR95_00825 [Rhizobiaceae bacterium LC148]